MLFPIRTRLIYLSRYLGLWSFIKIASYSWFYVTERTKETVKDYKNVNRFNWYAKVIPNPCWIFIESRWSSSFFIVFGSKDSINSMSLDSIGILPIFNFTFSKLEQRGPGISFPKKSPLKLECANDRSNVFKFFILNAYVNAFLWWSF